MAKAKKKSARTAGQKALTQARHHLRSAPSCKLRRDAAGVFLTAARARIKEEGLSKKAKASLMKEAHRVRKQADRFCETLHQRVSKAEKQLEKAKSLAFHGLGGKRRRRRRR